MRARLLVVICLLGACTGQVAPDRSALPDVAAVLPPPHACGFATGPPRGVSVTGTLPGSAAAGILLAGDLIVSVDGVATLSATELGDVMETKEVGQEVEIEIVRGEDPRTVAIALGPGADDEARPMIGVTISTSYTEVLPEEVPVADGIDSPYARLVLVNGELFAIDPSTPEVVAVDLDLPALPWLAAGGTLYRVDGTGTEARVVGHDGGEVTMPSGVTLVGLLGSVGDDLLAAVGAEGEPARVAALDPETSEVLWEYSPPPEQGTPVGTLANPSGTAVIVGLVPAGSEDPGFVVLSAADGSIRAGTEVMAAAQGGRMFGWFDDDTILAQTTSGQIRLVDGETGESTETSLSLRSPSELRLWPVGDGSGILVQDGDVLLSGAIDAQTDLRPLVNGCAIEYLDQVGSGRF